jgi:hypothetical protein
VGWGQLAIHSFQLLSDLSMGLCTLRKKLAAWQHQPSHSGRVRTKDCNKNTSAYCGTVLDSLESIMGHNDMGTTGERGAERGAQNSTPHAYTAHTMTSFL